MYGPEGADPNPGPGDRWQGREPTAKDDPDGYCSWCREPLYRIAGSLCWEWTGCSFLYHICPDKD